ncbi:MAG: 3D domain-containing protein [Oscillospiraceae bacterium]|nr:3D domain-containing protein [Candidatus Limimonas egerieequi]
MPNINGTNADQVSTENEVQVGEIILAEPEQDEILDEDCTPQSDYVEEEEDCVENTYSYSPSYTSSYSGSMTMTITGYCSCPICCGQWAYNRPKDENGNDIVCGASGRVLISGYSCATNSLPLGTLIEIDGLGTWRVDDRGTAGIDLYYADHDAASSVGRQTRSVTIIG